MVVPNTKNLLLKEIDVYLSRVLAVEQPENNGNNGIQNIQNTQPQTPNYVPDITTLSPTPSSNEFMMSDGPLSTTPAWIFGKQNEFYVIVTGNNMY